MTNTRFRKKKKQTDKRLIQKKRRNIKKKIDINRPNHRREK